MRPISRKDLIKKLKGFGYYGPLSGGNHQYMKKGSHKLRIPNKHKKKDIHPDLLKRILKQANIDEKEWEKHSK